MSNIRHFIATERFWETLEALRDKPDFDVIRRKIDEVLVRKAENAIFRSDRDKPFDADARLKGIWHCKLTSESDAVLFYALKGDAVVLGFVGSHKDYPFNGSNDSKVPTLVQKMKRALEARHVDSPSWKRLHWTIPDDLVHNRRLFELDIAALKAISDRLVEERTDAPIYEAVYGRPLLEAATDQEFEAWMTSIDRALAAVRSAARQVEIGARSVPEKGLIAAVRRNIDDVEPLTVMEICGLIRKAASAVLSVYGGRHVAAPLKDMVDVLETDPHSLDGSRMSYLVGEAARVLADAGHELHDDLAAALFDIQELLENPEGDTFLAHAAAAGRRR